jgi:hypothetical protein
LEKDLDMKVKEKCPRGSPRSKWEEQARNGVTQRERKPWKRVVEKLWEDVDRWRGLVIK